MCCLHELPILPPSSVSVIAAETRDPVIVPILSDWPSSIYPKAGFSMRYHLRTLLIVFALGPSVLAVAWGFASKSYIPSAAMIATVWLTVLVRYVVFSQRETAS